MHCLYLKLLANVCLSFISKCVNSDSYMAKVVVRHAILYGHMTSPLRLSVSYCGLQFKFNIGHLLDHRFDYCNLVSNNHLSSVSTELSANVSVLRDFLLFKEKPDICSHLFDTDEIATFIKS